MKPEKKKLVDRTLPARRGTLISLLLLHRDAGPLRPLARRTPFPLPTLPHRRAFRLARIHLPNQWPSYTPYPLASELQSVLAAPHHAYKASSSPSSPRSPAAGDAPNPPALLLVALLLLFSRPPLLFTPEIHHSPRRPHHLPRPRPTRLLARRRPPLPLHPHLSVRAYASLLEDVTASLLSSRFGIATFRDPDNPGVWVRSSSSSSSFDPPPRRNPPRAPTAKSPPSASTSADTSPPSASPSTSSSLPPVPHVNPWSRFVPCGIPDRDVTSVAAELGLDTPNPNPDPGASADKGLRWSLLEPALVAEEWADEFQRRLRADISNQNEDGDAAANFELSTPQLPQSMLK
ncbi:unnamed protein product [Parascedosporium putredinis]|uniref:BPL/LPL catalytic domain-containing protein n=1 Tax=Parascedosporium putredinis TaxID=1442378 RepID=A0A9P1M7M1_9PEZI|nr:unnamed protein product [Parascedosporium putredinis]CAI7988316.1 unnamed protein product [Parascedosporium putredinis]